MFPHVNVFSNRVGNSVCVDNLFACSVLEIFVFSHPQNTLVPTSELRLFHLESLVIMPVLGEDKEKGLTI